MGMGDYTRGPLEIAFSTSVKPDEWGDVAIVDGEHRVIGEAFDLVALDTHRPALANATLWAAAGELLESIEHLRELLENNRHYLVRAISPDDLIVLGKAMAAVDDAIAKAKGGL